MEEARQHTSLTPEQWAFGSIILGGPIVLAAGLIFQLAGITDALDYGLGLFVGSRVIVHSWQLMRPDASPKPAPQSRVALILIVWVAVGVVLLFVR
jgi:hypothetical protein